MASQGDLAWRDDSTFGSALFEMLKPKEQPVELDAQLYEQYDDVPPAQARGDVDVQALMKDGFGLQRAEMANFKPR